jgi:hypothetical protein
LNYHDLELTLDDLVEIRQQSVLEEAEEAKSEPEERTVAVLKVTEGLALSLHGV